jgi:photosystem II stability/assembly factor-like uncharacterized protein
MRSIRVIFTLNLYSQQTNNYTYHIESNYWSIDNPLQNQGNPEPDVFTWQYATIPNISNITDVIFIDTAKGWITHTNTGAARTTDGGFNWDLISFHDSTFTTLYNGVYFINQNTGWCVGGAVQIRKTTDGGLQWFKQYSAPVAGVLNNIYFFDSNNGIAIGRKTASYNSFMERTTNGGNAWSEIVVSTPSNNELHDQYWFDSNTGWVCGRNILLKTTNGGINWTNQYANIPPTQNGQNELLSIWFVNQQTGWIGGSNLDSKNIYKTINGGLNWVFQNNPVSFYTYTQINDMRFLTADSGWAVHGTPFSGAIMSTTNGGVNWIIEEGSNYWFDCITNYQRFKAWCGSSSGRVWYTYLTSVTGIQNAGNKIPESYKLFQNYPNPFNPVTVIEFDISANTRADLSVFDITGRKIETLLKGDLSAGKYKFDFNAENYSSGIYFYRLETSGFTKTMKMVMIK